MSGAIEKWFAGRGWKPMPFQQAAWDAYYEGESGLLAVPTGSGKTYAATLAAIAEGLPKNKLSILYLTPLRALSRDITISLQEALDALAPGHKVETRTGDTSSHKKTKQLTKVPSVMVTTPESLAVLLTQKNSAEFFADLKLVVADEWHELLGTKRGVFTELLLAKLRALRPGLRTWALSATIGNLDDALRSALGEGEPGRMIRGDSKRPVDIEVIVPKGGEWIPWGGHLGLYCLEEVLAYLDPEKATILFTNTRNQAERWYQALSIVKEEWGSQLALHHGSLHAKERERVELGIKDGSIRIVVATSSLDLGVDFPAVDRVFQIGSPKNVARMVQRAGRTRHRPGERSQLYFVPSQLLECAEIEAVRAAIEGGQVESKPLLDRPFDVLAQHLITLACEIGFTPAEAFREVRTASSYRNLELKEFDWVLTFLEKGGGALGAYPEYRKIARGEDGRFRVAAPRITRLHKMNLGTIHENADMEVRFTRGGKIGRIEENYLSRLEPGDRFYFAGRSLELVRMDEKGALVKLAKSAPDSMPAWGGGRMPLSETLCAELRPLLASYSRGAPYGLSRLLDQQQERSAVPKDTEVLCEWLKSKDGSHLFVYPFEGR
ncbi:MAG: DEAD/DEAH box helicase, partial [Proteobacteria bacterium]